MNTKLKSFTLAALMLVMCLALVRAAAQSPSEQAKKALAQKVPAGSVQACSLITRADVTKATGLDPFVDPEPAGQGGWICNVGIGELKVYSGPKSWEAWESTLKGFRRQGAANAGPRLRRACVLLLPEAGQRVSRQRRLLGREVGQLHDRAVA